MDNTPLVLTRTALLKVLVEPLRACRVKVEDIFAHLQGCLFLRLVPGVRLFFALFLVCQVSILQQANR